jgi:hypothetical protein
MPLLELLVNCPNGHAHEDLNTSSCKALAPIDDGEREFFVGVSWDVWWLGRHAVRWQKGQRHGGTEGETCTVHALTQIRTLLLQQLLLFRSFLLAAAEEVLHELRLILLSIT